MLSDPKRSPEEEPQEALLTWFLNAWKAVEENYPKILAGLGAVVVAVLIVVFVQQQNATEDQAAQQALGDVYIALFKGDVATAISKSQQVLVDFAGMPAAREALMAMANLNFEEGRTDQARSQFQQYLDSYGSEGPLGYGAWSGLAACLEQAGDFSEAAEHLLAYVAQYPTEPFAAIALKEAARCYELAGDRQKAQEAYQEILKEYRDASVANVARGKLSMMGIDVAS